jgi:SWI/SNF-related matrix-associated actin-dependent regulator of chromatin subfamily A-like protein 1
LDALFPYQEIGAAWLASRERALLADEMGLGKTPQAVRGADLAGAWDVLVLAPAAVCENWRREFLRWQTVLRQARVVRKVEQVGPGVNILSYDMARSRPMLNLLLAKRWCLLVCDEAHYLKNPSAERTRAVLGPRLDGVGGLLSSAARAWGLTGTPMPNWPDELWPLLKAFGPEALAKSDGSPVAFHPWKTAYCVTVPIGQGRSKTVGVRNTEDLKARVAKVMLRRKKAEVLADLPPLTEGEIALDPGAHAKDLRELDDGETGDILRRVRAAALLSDDVEKAVQQVLQDASQESVSRLRRITAAVKARALAPLLADEMGQTERKLVVMGWHGETLDVMQDALADFGAVRLCGKTSPAQRQAAIDAFQNDAGTRVFVGQIQAAGTGITLTAAADLVFAEMSWTPAENAQAAMRIHRVGQHRPVLVRYATLAGTIDEAVVKVLRRKTQAARTILS